MDVQGPPIRYPAPRLITPENRPTRDSDQDNDNGNDSAFRASDDSTLAESLPPSPRQPPAYGEERAPPQYQEDDDPDDVKARRKVRRTLCIRLLTSIFITVLVSLIVAAVVARIHDSNINTDWSSNETASNTTNGTSFTMTSSNKATSVQSPGMTATETALQNVKTAMVAHKADPTTTTSSKPSPNATAIKVGQTVDCPSLGVFVNATPVTSISPAPTRITTSKRKRKVHQLVAEDEQMLGLAVYSFNGCLLSRTSYKDSEGSLEYRCTMSCPDKRWETNQARDVVTDEWGACG